MSKVLVAGVGMIPFTKPGSSETYPVMGSKAAALALKDSTMPRWSMVMIPSTQVWRMARSCASLYVPSSLICRCVEDMDDLAARLRAGMMVPEVRMA